MAIFVLNPCRVRQFPQFVRRFGEERIPSPLGVDFIQHDLRKRILLRVGQLTGLRQRRFKQFGHNGNIVIVRSSSRNLRVRRPFKWDSTFALRLRP
jgi:hypothetical protein